MKKTRFTFGEIYILRNCIVILVCLPLVMVAAKVLEWGVSLVLGVFVIQNLWSVIRFLIDLLVGPKKARMHYKRVKYIDGIFTFWLPTPRYKYGDIRNYGKYKWLATTIELYGKGKKIITVRTICAGDELMKYTQKECLDVTYYKYSGIVKEIIY
ncbi:hypothetical protein ACQRAS_08285 [Coprococcus catus]